MNIQSGSKNFKWGQTENTTRKDCFFFFFSSKHRNLQLPASMELLAENVSANTQMKSQQQHVLKQIWSGSLTDLYTVLDSDIFKNIKNYKTGPVCRQDGSRQGDAQELDFAECVTVCCEDYRLQWPINKQGLLIHTVPWRCKGIVAHSSGSQMVSHKPKISHRSVLKGSRLTWKTQC